MELKMLEGPVLEETLFSFEFLVEYVRFDLVHSCKEPAVGVRLLDFPTLLIYRTENPSLVSDDKKQTPEVPYQTQKDCLEFTFQKGKSCLFKINLDSLHTHLSNTPLYAMVLDVRDEIPKLMGSCLVSLARITERIKTDVDKHGINTPAAYGERGVSILCNLMGKRIGTISLGYKIVSLGANLIPHIPENRIYKTGTLEQHVQPPADQAVEEGNGQIQSKHHTTHALSQRVHLEGQPTDIVVSEVKTVKRVTACTQTNRSKKGVKTSQLVKVLDEETTTFCPPPLFYCSIEKQRERWDENYRSVNTRMESLRMEDLYSESESVEMDGTSPSKDQGVEVNVGKTIRPQPEQTALAPSVLGDAITQLPLLNALLIELSQLSHNGQTQQHQPLSVHPNLAWLYASAQGPVTPADRGRSSPETPKATVSSQQRVSQSFSPSHKHGLLQVKSKPMHLSVKEATENYKQRDKSPPKRKLRSGSTNTFRLRLKQVKQGVSKQRECMTNFQKTKQAETPRRKLSSSKQAHKLFNKGVHLDDEALETLVNSVEIETYPQEKSFTLQRPGVRSRGQSKNHPPDNEVTSLKTQTGRTLPIMAEKGVQVHIPSALSQNSNHCAVEHPGDPTSNGQPNVTSPVSRPVTPTVRRSSLSSSENDGDPNGRDSQCSSPTQKPCSRDDSPELEYQDDFTSLDATDGFSPEPLSSPEPCRSRRAQIPSGHLSSDNDTYRGEVLPVPVQGASSPQRTLRGTHIIRPRPQTSALSVSSDDDDSGSVSILSVSFQQKRNGSQRSQPKTVASNRSESPHSNRAESTPSRGRSVDPFIPLRDSVPESLSYPDSSESEEKKDKLGSLGFDKKYRHVSELVVNKLPGYTL